MSQNYQSIGYDSANLKPFEGTSEKTILSPIEADSQFGDGSMPGMKLQSGPNLTTFGFPDNFDSTYPFILPYYIDSSAKVTRATISLFFQPYRAYETGAASGGSSSVTSAGGGGQTSSSTTQNSTIQTTDTSGQTAHFHSIQVGNKDNSGSHDLGVLRYDDHLDGNGGLYVDANYGAGAYSKLWTNTTESAHNHNVTITNVSHSHTVSDHTHSVDIPNHTHGITYGIFSSGYPTSVSMTIDGVDVTAVLGGPWNPTAPNPSFVDLDITKYTGSSGTHTLQLTTTGQGRCIPLLIIKSVLGSKS